MATADSELSTEEVQRRLPTLELIDDPRTKAVTTRLSQTAPDYFWEVPASASNYHHPACRGHRGLWAHTLMLSTVIDRLADSYVGQGLITEHEVDYAHAAAILHDQRKNGDPANPSETSVSDHDIRMAEVVAESALDDAIAAAIGTHMGCWYDGPEPESNLDQLVHTADMVASTESITPGIQGPIPDELAELGLEEVDLR
ncbi:HD domain-containing protein [Halomontanus rarus]|uniref:HD domain-containing protein n=1 Tax=Halomontanus rarus TaxID=3034020 RepID=UPI00307CA1DC